MTPVRVIVTGCRHWAPYDLAESIVTRMLHRYGPGLVVVHGDCPTGWDRVFREACEAVGVDHEPHPADWSLGRRAGPLRNKAMVDLGARFCLAGHRDLMSSKGTLGCVRLALAAGIPVWLIADEGGEPRRWEGA